MQIEIPDLTSQQVGQLVLQLAAQSQIPAVVAPQVLALQHIARGLASGALHIVAIDVPQQDPTHTEDPASTSVGTI